MKKFKTSGPDVLLVRVKRIGQYGISKSYSFGFELYLGIGLHLGKRNRIFSLCAHERPKQAHARIQEFSSGSSVFLVLNLFYSLTERGPMVYFRKTVIF